MYIANKYNTLWWFIIYRKFRVDQKLTVFIVNDKSQQQICYVPIIIAVELILLSFIVPFAQYSIQHSTLY